LDLEPIEIQDRLRGLFEVSNTRARYIEWIVRNLKAWKQAFSVP
jgi:hypothetical protein